MLGEDVNLYPPFDPNDPDLTDFIIHLPDGVTEINVSKFPVDPDKKVDVIGADDLVPGINIIKISITDDDGSVKEYTIAAIVGGDSILPDGGTANLFANWWWLLLIALALGTGSGYFIKKITKKKEGESQWVADL